MGEKLNLETFNNLLFSAFKDQSPEALLRLYAMELESAYALKIQAMEQVIDDLNNNKPYGIDLQKVNNIDSNLDYLQEKMETLEKENPQLREIQNETNGKPN